MCGGEDDACASAKIEGHVYVPVSMPALTCSAVAGVNTCPKRDAGGLFPGFLKIREGDLDVFGITVEEA